MGLFTKKAFESLDDVLFEQIEDLYDAEVRLTKALPKMAEAAQTRELALAFTSHLAETERHVERLEQVFRELGKEPVREACEGIKGLISEGSEMISAKGDGEAKDAALIAAAQRIEHYEMAGYGTARTLAEHLGHDGIASILQKTLDEEGAADKKLTKIAETSIYKSKPKTVKAAKTTKSASAHSGNGRRKAKSTHSKQRGKRSRRAMAKSA